MDHSCLTLARLNGSFSTAKRQTLDKLGSHLAPLKKKELSAQVVIEYVLLAALIGLLIVNNITPVREGIIAVFQKIAETLTAAVNF